MLYKGLVSRLYYSSRIFTKSKYLFEQTSLKNNLSDKKYLTNAFVSNAFGMGHKSKYLFRQVLINISTNVNRHFADGTITESNDLYKEIYRFPSIKLGYLFQKSKWYQTLLMGAATCSSGILYYSGLIDASWTFGVIGSGCMLTFTLYGYTKLFNQAIGFVYLSKEGTTVKISYLDYWGRRVDMESPVEDVVPLSESPTLLTDRLFKQISFYSRNQLKLKLYVQHGKITDMDRFHKVFGTIY